MLKLNLYSLNTETNTTYDGGYPGPEKGHAHKSGGD